MARLSRKFYQRDAETLARALLGQVLAIDRALAQEWAGKPLRFVVG